MSIYALPLQISTEFKLEHIGLDRYKLIMADPIKKIPVWLTIMIGLKTLTSQLGTWLRDTTNVQEVVGLNPGTVYWMTWHFSHWFVVKIVVMFEKTENQRKRGRGWLIFKKKSTWIANQNGRK